MRTIWFPARIYVLQAEGRRAFRWASNRDVIARVRSSYRSANTPPSSQTAIPASAPACPEGRSRAASPRRESGPLRPGSQPLTPRRSIAKLTRLIGQCTPRWATSTPARLRRATNWSELLTACHPLPQKQCLFKDSIRGEPLGASRVTVLLRLLLNPRFPPKRLASAVRFRRWPPSFQSRWAAGFKDWARILWFAVARSPSAVSMLPFKLVCARTFYLPIGQSVFPVWKYRLMCEHLLKQGIAGPEDFRTCGSRPPATCSRSHSTRKTTIRRGSPHPRLTCGCQMALATMNTSLSWTRL
jgi:hypothetical protein